MAEYLLSWVLLKVNSQTQMTAQLIKNIYNKEL